MARIRTIKPEFPQSESMGRISRDARLLFIQLWTLCDDLGNTRASSRMLASLLYPYDEDASKLLDSWIEELEREKCIDLYEVEGSRYLHVRNWLIHQKIDRPGGAKFPEFDEKYRIIANGHPLSSSVRDNSRQQHERSSGDQGPRTKEGRKEKENTTPHALSVPELVADGLTAETATEFLAHRKRKRSTLTPLAWRVIREEAGKAGVTIEIAVRKCISRGWIGLEAEWILRDKPAAAPPEQRLVQGRDYV